MNRIAGFARGCAVLTLAVAGVAAAQPEARFVEGKRLFDAQCAVCHQAGGKGQDGLAPPLTEYPGRYARFASGRAQLTSTLVYGMFGEITVRDKRYNFKMPSFASLSDDQLADVLNYVALDLSAQPAGAKPFTAEEIRAARAKDLDAAAVHAQRGAVAKEAGL